MEFKAEHGAAIVVLAAAGGLAYLASKNVPGNIMPLQEFTESHEGPVMEFLPDKTMLTRAPVTLPHRYPASVAPNLSAVISKGFAPAGVPADPQLAALPSEEAW